MKITQVETIRVDEFPNLLFIRITTDEGISGLGETYYGARAVESYIHETAAPYLLGQDPLAIDRHARSLYGYVGYRSSGAEMRGNSAIDIALWDIFGKTTSQPLYQLLGGKFRDDIRIYNTCAGYRYVRNQSRQAVSNWGIDQTENSGPYEDLDGFLYRADELAQSLLEQGITGMKIWPFDPFAEESGGHYLSSTDLERALLPFQKIRDAAGNRMDIMVELHGMWDAPMAKIICHELEAFKPLWYEDPVKADNIDALAEVARSTHVPIAASETLATRWSFREVLERGAAGIVMVDVSWTGGISEARKIAYAAEAYQRPVMFHDCTGPVVLSASTHLSLHASNALIQETVRAFYTGWYNDLVTQLPPIQNGRITALDRPGHGIELLPGLEKRQDAQVGVSNAPRNAWTTLDPTPQTGSGREETNLLPE